MRTLYLSLLLVIALPLTAWSQTILTESMDYIKKIDSIDSAPLKNHIQSVADAARIIGLGEVSHYTKECYQIKQQLIQTLMKNGFTCLILEVEFGQALVWNDYVTKGKGNLDSIIAQSGWFTYRTEEFKNLIRDIRQHNTTAASPFQLFGMEMTAMNNNLDWLRNYFKNNLEDSEDILGLLTEERKIVAFMSYETEERNDYWNLYYGVAKVLSEKERELKEKGGEREFLIANRMSEIIRQYATYISQDDYSLKAEFRDQFSARNVLWTLDYLGDESKAVIWAHNGHVAKESILFNYNVLGHYLERWFGEDYYSIGFTFNQGTFGAFSNEGFKKWEMPPVDQPSFSMDFHQMNSPFLLFDIRNNLAADSRLNSYLRTEQLIRTDISESYNEEWNKYMDINLANTYDCLIYIEETHYPTSIEWVR